MIEKITSRKFWVALISIITGILGIVNCDDNIIVFVGSALTVIIPTVVYIITEGKIDSQRVTSTAQELLGLVQELLTQLNDDANNIDNTQKDITEVNQDKLEETNN